VRLGGAWTTLAGRRLRIVTALAQADGPAPGLLVAGVAGTAAGGLRLVTVQPEGRAAMPWASFANGARLPEPAVLDR
jgi:methionyl-tRNA formyltransferase